MRPTSSTPTRASLVVALLLALSFQAPSLHAQAAPTPSGGTTVSSSVPADEETLMLDPFTVTTEHEGYQAVDTLAGGRVRTKLVDTPSAISVITKKFLDDLSITNPQDLLIYTTNTEVGGLNGNFSGIASRGFGASAGEGSRLQNPAGTNRSRGLTAMDNARNYFQSEIPWDGFNISRVDISRGPNSFLFGVGSPSGISNYSTNEAIFKDTGSVVAHVGSFGTTRETVDLNKVIIPKELAVRVDLVNDDTEYKQKPAYNHSKRAYGALRYDPSFLETPTAHTKILFNIETGKVDSNNPRELPPLDMITGYFDASVKKAGYDPFTYRAGQNGAPNGFDPAAGPQVSTNDMGYIWPGNTAFWYEGATGTQIMSGQPGSGANRPGGSTPIAGLQPAGGGNAYSVYLTGFNEYARNVNYLDSTKYPGAYLGTVNYINKTLNDPSIFDFYNKLIDGPNKHEWQRWNTFNLTLVQSLFSDRLSIQAVAERERFSNGHENMLGNPYISVDLNSYLNRTPSWLPGAATNPNEGRPFTAGDFSGGASSSDFTNNNYQVTAAYSLRFDDFLSNKSLATLLGNHELTALGGQYTTGEEDRTWFQYGTDAAFAQKYLGTDNINVRTVQWVSYLGPSLNKASSASGANLSNVATVIAPISGPVTFFDNTWTAGTSVNPADPWTNPVPGAPATQTQADNPANYKGYTSTNATILNARNNRDQLYTTGSKREQRIRSEALMYQGHFWNNTIVPEFGWRRDKVRQRGTQASLNAQNVANMNYENNDPGVEVSTTSTSYGLALHLPPSIKKNLPAGTDVSVYYFHGKNETPKVRYGFDGNLLPNEQGKTDDYGLQVDTLNGRATFRLTYFKTVDKYATAAYGSPLGGYSWLIDSLPMWTLTMATSGIIAAHNDVNALPYTDGFQYQSWFWGWGQSDPAKADRIAAAMKTDFVKMFPQAYWNQWGMGDWFNMAAVQNGDWTHVVKTAASPLTWNFPNAHVIHGVGSTMDQDLVSKGYEMEATIRPTKNWDITFNASQVKAYQTALGADVQNYMNGLAKLWINTAIGETPEWGGGPIGPNEFLPHLWSAYQTQLALSGTDQPELRKWNFHIISNYNFDKGVLKGIGVGGAYRWASKNIVGYGASQQTQFGQTGYYADTSKPFYGPTDEHLDLWVAYGRHLTPKIDWKVQLNVRNVGESPNLVPVAFEPDGSIAQQRIRIGQTYDLSLRFSF